MSNKIQKNTYLEKELIEKVEIKIKKNYWSWSAYITKLINEDLEKDERTI